MTAGDPSVDRKGHDIDALTRLTVAALLLAAVALLVQRRQVVRTTDGRRTVAIRATGTACEPGPVPGAAPGGHG